MRMLSQAGALRLGLRRSLVGSTYWYFANFFYFLGAGTLESKRAATGDGPGSHASPRTIARAGHVYSLARTFLDWDLVHYRAPTFGADISANLRNLALPGTGLRLDFWCQSKWSALFFMLMIIPIASFMAAVWEVICPLARSNQAAAVLWSPAALARTWWALCDRYAEHLLDPQHWFALWRLNCLIVARHSYLTAGALPAFGQYALEDKGRFLLDGHAAGVPVTPFFSAGDCESLVAKHRSIEGGMGIHMLRNFAAGGDWILQKRLRNSAFIAGLLPADAPLSTLRVITASTHWLRRYRALGRGAASVGGAIAEAGVVPPSRCQAGSKAAAPGPLPLSLLPPQTSDFSVSTVVFRAGLAGASTDHKSICFRVNAESGRIGQGVSNLHWYQLGWKAVGRIGIDLASNATGRPTGCADSPISSDSSVGEGSPATAGVPACEVHPDTGKRVTGAVIPDFGDVTRLVLNAHATLVPDVPLVGWVRERSCGRATQIRRR